MLRSPALVLAVLASVGVVAGGAEAAVQSFTGPGGVIPDQGPAVPYPSQVLVSGASGGSLTVTISGLTHTFPGDLLVEVVNPAGASARLMVEAGGGFPVAGVTLSFSDGAASALPNNGQIVSGTYLPTDYDPGDCLPGAPGSCTATALAPLAGTPNGLWSLYVYDENAGDSGSFASWSISFTTGDAPQPPGRGGYCSVAGDKNPLTGVVYGPGTFLDLQLGQPDTDSAFKGATPASFYEGIGLSCDPPPAGYRDSGTKVDQTGRPAYFADAIYGGIYEYWTKPKT
jgi:subtilisin-like proprotein convertase family protein